MTGEPIGVFVSKLEERRVRLGLDNATFAREELGISPALWSRLRSGQRPVSREMARAVAGKWPEFASYYAADLSSDRQAA